MFKTEIGTYEYIELAGLHDHMINLFPELEIDGIEVTRSVLYIVSNLDLTEQDVASVRDAIESYEYTPEVIETVNEVESLKIIQTLVKELAKNELISEEAIFELPTKVFPIWTIDFKSNETNVIVRGSDGALYKSIHPIIDASQNVDPVEDIQSLIWRRISNPNDEWPDWLQPLGSQDAYTLGAKVAHNSKNWISTVDNNIWEPGVYGWEEVNS